jgi:exosortase/archaeosortase family protein
VAVLTPFVEIPDGPLAYVANHHVCLGLLFAFIALILLAGREVRSPVLVEVSQRPLTWLWLSVNLVLYLVFFQLSWGLSNNRSPTTWLAAVLWVVLAAGVGLSAVLAFFPLATATAWVHRCRVKILTAGALGAGVALLGPWVQSFWPLVCGPALVLDQRLLEWTYGEGITGVTTQGVPVLGTGRFGILVTPGCSGLEAFVALWLLAAVVVPSWHGCQKMRLGFGLLLGTGLLYVLNAVRLFSLVVIGTEITPQACVSVAHSQIGSIGFFALDLVLLAGIYRCCRSRHTGAEVRGQMSA